MAKGGVVTVSTVSVMASQKWADHIAQILADNGVNVPVISLAATGRASRCSTCGRPLLERESAA